VEDFGGLQSFFYAFISVMMDSTRINSGTSLIVSLTIRHGHFVETMWTSTYPSTLFIQSKDDLRGHV
jgi:hypothetical protein